MRTLTGHPTIFALDHFAEHANQVHPLGTLAIMADGRKFRYAKAGAAALAMGKIQQGPAIVANHQNIAVAAAAAIGAEQVTVTLGATAATADQYKEGYLIVNDATGEGQTLKIKSHPAADSSGSLVIKLEDAVKVALTTSSEVCLIPNPWNGVIIYPTTSTLAPAGVAPFAVAAGKYCWLQTGGPCSALADGAIAVMSGIAVPAAVAGAVKIMAATLSQVGYALQAGVDTEYRAVHLTID
jgi:hypothetical protein